MPQHDGFELVGKLKSLYPIRAVAVTGYGMPDELTRLAAGGFDDFLLKPVDFTRLQNAIETVAVAVAFDLNRDQQAQKILGMLRPIPN